MVTSMVLIPPPPPPHAVHYVTVVGSDGSVRLFSDAYIFGSTVSEKHLQLGSVYLLSKVFTIFLKPGFSTMYIA